MRNRLLALLFAWVSGAYGLDFENFTARANLLHSELGQVCSTLLGSFENLTIYELYLSFLFNWPYHLLLSTSLLQKKTVIEEFKSNFCQDSILGVSTAPKIDLFQSRSSLETFRKVKDVLNYSWSQDNLVYTEYLLYLLGKSYRNLINLNMEEKRLKLSNLLSFTAPISAPILPNVSTNPVAIATGGAGGPAPVVALYASKTGCVYWGAISYLGGSSSFCLVNDADVNQLALSSYPVVGKYLGGDGYPMANMSVVIDNNLISSELLKIVPEQIRRVIPEGYITDFYTEVLDWNQADTDPTNISFEAKGRQFNLIFHGTMMNWFADKYKDFNFALQSISENLKMGIFEYDGIIKTDQIGNNCLVLQSVNPHNDHLSPDNARFTVSHDRNIVTLWSVAVSDVKKRSIVTYHILVNKDYYPDLVAQIEHTTQEANQLADLIARLNILTVAEGLDNNAWGRAMAFLSELYRV